MFQIRHAFRRTRSGYLSTHKDYVLVGLNESGTMFRHPVSAHPIRAAARIDPHDPLAPIRAAQRWMWQVTAKQLERAHGQGDVLIVPERLSPPESAPIHESEVVLGGSQFLRADTLTWFNGRQYARRPTLHHIKRQDLTIRGDNRWYSARLVREAPTCSWGTRIGD